MTDSSNDIPGGVTQRPRYFDGMFLQSQDLMDEHDHVIGQQQTSQRYLRMPGVLEGLRVVWAAGTVPVLSVEKGAAVDREGRLIVLRDPRPLDPPATAAGTYWICIEFREEPAGMSAQTADGRGVKKPNRFTQNPKICVLDLLPSTSALLLARFSVTNSGIDKNSLVDLRQASGIRLPNLTPEGILAQLFSDSLGRFVAAGLGGVSLGVINTMDPAGLRRILAVTADGVKIDGALSTTGDLAIGGTIRANAGILLPAGQDLSVQGAVNTSTLSVSAAATVAGTLTASAGVALNSIQPATASQPITIAGATTVSGALTTSGVLTAQGGITTSSMAASGMLTANGGITIPADKGVSAGGAVSVAGMLTASTLSVSAAATVAGTLTASAGVALNSIQPATASQPITIAGATTVSGALTTSGVLTAQGGITTSSMAASGMLTANGGITIPADKGVSAGGAVSVAGMLTASTLSVSAAATVAGTLTASAGVALNSIQPVTASQPITIAGATTVSGALTTSGVLTAQGGITTSAMAASGMLTANGGITIPADKGVSAGGAVSVAGMLTASTLSVSAAATVAGTLTASAGVALNSIQPATASQPITIAGATTVSGALNTTGALTATGLFTAQGGISASAITALGSQLTVNGPVVTTGLLTANGALVANQGLTVSTTQVAPALDVRGELVSSGKLTAKSLAAAGASAGLVMSDRRNSADTTKDWSVYADGNALNAANNSNLNLIITTDGDVTARRTVIADGYRLPGDGKYPTATFAGKVTTSAPGNVYLYGTQYTKDAWVYLDTADPNANWGLYHRQIDTDVLGLPGNSIGFIGASALKAYVSLVTGDAGFMGKLSVSGDIVAASNVTLTGTLSGTGKINIQGDISSQGKMIASGDLVASKTVIADGFRLPNDGNYATSTYQGKVTTSAPGNVYLYGTQYTKDSWIYLDTADPNANWGIYHRQIDTDVLGLPGNSIGFIGASALKAYISLASGDTGFMGKLSVSGAATISGPLTAAAGLVVSTIKAPATNQSITLDSPTTFSGTLSTTGALTAQGGISASAITALGSQLTVNGPVVTTGLLTANGALVANQGLTVSTTQVAPALDVRGELVSSGKLTAKSLAAAGASAGLVMSDRRNSADTTKDWSVYADGNALNAANNSNLNLIITTDGDVTARRTVIADGYRLPGDGKYPTATFAGKVTTSAPGNVYLYGTQYTKDAWVYLDTADPNANWGLYHRQIDTDVLGLPGNSIGFIGASALKAYVSLATGDAGFMGKLSVSGDIVAASNVTLTGTLSGTGKINIQGDISSQGKMIASGDLVASKTVIADGFRLPNDGNYATSTYQGKVTTSAPGNVYLYGTQYTKDSWIYLDTADPNANWGVYHRQIDTDVLGLPGNSIGFIGASALKAYISLASGDAGFTGKLSVSGAATISGPLTAAAGLVVSTIKAPATNQSITLDSPTTFSGTLSTTGALTAQGGISASAITALGSQLTVNGPVVTTGLLTANGALVANQGLTAKSLSQGISSAQRKDVISLKDGDHRQLLDDAANTTLAYFRYLTDDTSALPRLGVIAETCPAYITTDNGRALSVTEYAAMLHGALKSVVARLVVLETKVAALG